MKRWMPYAAVAAFLSVQVFVATRPETPCPVPPLHDCPAPRLQAELKAALKEHSALEAEVARHEYWVHAMGDAAADGHRTTMQCAEELEGFRAHAADIHGCSYRHGRRN